VKTATLEAPADFSHGETQTALPSAALVEYYSAGDRLVAAVVTRETIEIIPLRSSRASPIGYIYQVPVFKISHGKRLHATLPTIDAACYLGSFGNPLWRTDHASARAISRAHLVFVPHGPHALSTVFMPFELAMSLWEMPTPSPMHPARRCSLSATEGCE